MLPKSEPGWIVCPFLVKSEPVLDKVGLLDVIGNEPAYEKDGGYFGALNRVSRSLNAMSDVLGDRLPPGSRTAQFVWAVGSVAGGDEGLRGAGGLRMLRAPQKNPLLEVNDPEALAHRATLLRNILTLLAHLPMPRYFPVVLIDCRTCKAVHYVNDPACIDRESVMDANALKRRVEKRAYGLTLSWSRATINQLAGVEDLGSSAGNPYREQTINCGARPTQERERSILFLSKVHNGAWSNAIYHTTVQAVLQSGRKI